MGIGPIPWLAIVQYMEYHELSEDLHETFHTVIAAMDAVYLEWADEASKKHGNLQHQGKAGQHGGKTRAPRGR